MTRQDDRASKGWDGHTPERKHPAHGVLILRDQPTIVFLTVCTQSRKPWLASPGVHALLYEVWREANAWAVGRYVIMPDHIHLFASPDQLEILLDNWVRYWKSQFTQRHGRPEHRWQSGHWDTRMRTRESYESKWEYVKENPVRHKLVASAEDWPYQGEIWKLAW